MEPNDVRDATEEPPKDRLNATVAVTVAILATFMGLCKVKDDNVCQAMQQAQADKIDDWGWYQAKKTRDEMMGEHVATLTIAAAMAAPVVRTPIQREIQRVTADLKEKRGELADTKAKAEGDGKDYDALNYRDDQFDLSDSALALSISLLAVTALTKKRALFAFALIPMGIGVLMGLAGFSGGTSTRICWRNGWEPRPRRRAQRDRAELFVDPRAIDHIDPDRQVGLHERLLELVQRPSRERLNAPEASGRGPTIDVIFP